MNDDRTTDFDQAYATLSKAIADEPPDSPADLCVIIHRGRRRVAIRKTMSVAASIVGVLTVATVAIVIFVIKPTFDPSDSASENPLQIMQPPSNVNGNSEPHVPDPGQAQRLQEVLRNHPALSQGVSVSNHGSGTTGLLQVAFTSDPHEAEYKAEAYLETRTGQGNFLFLANEPGRQSDRPACSSKSCDERTLEDGTQLMTVKDDDGPSDVKVFLALAVRPDGATISIQVDNQKKDGGVPADRAAKPPLAIEQLVQLVLSPELSPRS